ncbi:hypothetical protein A2276_04860 [candidate division WOR-1 bacterium RIFOXYA12_FULL_43_27]|uniref:Haloacid dehalogenase-like hydrolase n=1 Tax=candidate division WOR-1 bacterium RIFOXYC2_FULL_46_14 TaxID=1802587 RepID=A0A1F4U8J6_UNCSA|nr:MAG: hypothetical protein A2276_04860 [candidate division WOR-1 bacterium RIFOXYA12_FULL_43_27]OGC19997.1 MAG: hypothetical protein A2292_02865 [candidate division WOR-1 bacterium RIFOXYB2_FULL_46_45]OGC32266.1 MAG: hypothetical protein A2232_08580 [candidate division WOR-1 bacterium RIFOXYA2_FULL_46_56]OGC41170.1 MAG: hypothetical protein A2438_07520 [candidate division WOR-1 bacterium RIFOXYC2_FULL_46_14]
MKIYLFDVDNTIAPFRPTSELYKKTLLPQNRVKYLAIGYFMVVMLNLFWFIPFIVEFQRKLIMSMLSALSPSKLEEESEKIANTTTHLLNKKIRNIVDHKNENQDKIYLLTHCPTIIAQKIAKKLDLDGEYSIEIKNYFQPGLKIENLNKSAILHQLRKEGPNAQIYYFADDLIDLEPLLKADVGVLINASFSTKLVAMLFFRRVQIWS